MKFVILLFAVFTSFAAAGQAVIKGAEFKPWLGNWEGTFNYKDIYTGISNSLQVSVQLGPIVDGSKIAIAETFPADTGRNIKDTIRISGDGAYVSDSKLASKKKATDQFQFILETDGEDAGQKALVRFTYVFSKNKFTLKKEVRYRDQPDYFTRHEYKLTRR